MSLIDISRYPTNLIPILDGLDVLLEQQKGRLASDRAAEIMTPDLSDLESPPFCHKAMPSWEVCVFRPTVSSVFDFNLEGPFKPFRNSINVKNFIKPTLAHLKCKLISFEENGDFIDRGRQKISYKTWGEPTGLWEDLSGCFRLVTAPFIGLYPNAWDVIKGDPNKHLLAFTKWTDGFSSSEDQQLCIDKARRNFHNSLMVLATRAITFPGNEAELVRKALG